MRLFVEPMEPLLFRRTGRSFDAGESGFADTFFPPTPETLQGAIRAAVATHWDRTKTITEVFQQEKLVQLIGDRSGYGRFRITGLALGRIAEDDNMERLFPAPAHLLTVKGQDKQQQLIRLQPDAAKEQDVSTEIPAGMHLLYPDREVQEKLEPLGYWLTERGLVKALRTREDLTKEEKISNDQVFEFESRLGIGMNSSTKTTREGLLYQVRMVRMKPGYGFVIDVRLSHDSPNGTGADGIEALEDDSKTQEQLRLPDRGWITLGGERRAARFEVIPSTVIAGQATIEQASKGNLVYLATPAAFTAGWQPEQWPVPAAPMAASVHRYQLIGGWSLRPGDSGGESKSIRRCVPAGSVYFFDTSVSISRPWTDYGWQIGYGIAYAGER